MIFIRLYLTVTDLAGLLDIVSVVRFVKGVSVTSEYSYVSKGFCTKRLIVQKLYFITVILFGKQNVIAAGNKYLVNQYILLYPE